MIGNTAILKFSGGAAAVGGCGAAGYVFREQIKRFFNGENESYLIVTAAKETDPASDFTKKDGETTVKNYSCSIDLTGADKLKDENCQISKIEFSTTNKSINKEKLSQLDKTVENVSDFGTTDIYYKLKVSPEIMKKIDMNDNSIKTINLISKTPNETKKFAVLTPKIKFNNKIVEAKSDYLLINKSVASTGSDPEGTFTDYKCSYLSNQNKTCKIFNFAADKEKESTTNISEIIFDGTFTEKNSDFSGLKADKYFLLKLENSMFNFELLSENSDIKFESWTSSAKTTGKKNYSLKTTKTVVALKTDKSVIGSFIFD